MSSPNRLIGQQDFEETVRNYSCPNISERQMKLAAAFKEKTDEAFVIDQAETTSSLVPASTSLYGQVTPGDHGLPPISMGAHSKIGGNGDFPNPGELLCAAIAACYDSSLRIIFGRMNIKLRHLAVKVKGTVDVRGTLKLNKQSPVGFHKLTIYTAVKAPPDVPEQTIKAILKAAEESCVVLQTIKQAPLIEWSYKTR